MLALYKKVNSDDYALLFDDIYYPVNFTNSKITIMVQDMLIDTTIRLMGVIKVCKKVFDVLCGAPKTFCLLSNTHIFEWVEEGVPSVCGNLTHEEMNVLYALGLIEWTKPI